MKKDETIRIIIHILLWVVILALPVYSARWFRMGSNFLLTYYTFMAINGLIFYTNYFFLVPRLFFQKKKYRYYIATVVLIFLFYFISDFSNRQVYNYISKARNLEQLRYKLPEQTGRPPGPPPAQTMRERARYGIIIALPYARVIGYMSSSLFMVFLSLGVRVLERQSKILKMQEELQKATLNAELSILKNQISPHFFFNTLNNIYSLIGRNNEDSKNAVVKLSKLMRYVLNESGKDFKLLGEEIEFMSNYVDLMKLRMGAKTRLTVNFPSEFKNILIPHLLFISLIENAFKYGISVQEESYISISLETAGNSILFKCENGLPESNSGTVIESSGIGLENLKKRLSLLYPGRHVLEINRDNTKFEVNLNIQM